MSDEGLKPNLQVIRAHLERLFRRARKEYPDTLCEIAWTDDNGRLNRAQMFHVSEAGLDEAARVASLRNAEGRNVYVGVNPRKPGTAPFARAEADDIEVAYFHFADGDSAESAGRIRTAPLPYTYVVVTGRTPNPRPHAYWEVAEAVTNFDAWRRQQRAIANYFNSDAVIDPPRVMRLAGTVNYPSPKKAAERGYRPELVTLRTIYDDEERDPVDSEALYHAYPWDAPPRSNGHDHGNGHDQSYDPETGEFKEEKPQKPDFETGRPVDPLIWVRGIKAGRELHNNARQLIDHLIMTGHRDWLIRDYVSELLRPVSDGGTLGQVDELIRSWRERTNTPNPEPETEDFDAPPPPPPEASIAAIPYVFRDPTSLPPRDWLYGRHLIRGLVSCTVAPGGYGKSSMVTAEAMAMVTGRSLLGEQPKGTLRVWHINLEDPPEEIDRKLHAVKLHFKIEDADIGDRLFVGCGGNTAIVIAKESRDGIIIVEPVVERIKSQIIENNIDILQIDPFVASHEINENDNTKVNMVLKRWAEIAKEAKCAIELVHHVRKGPRGQDYTVDDARGASALVFGVRSARVLNAMTPEDAAKAGVENPYVYFQVANGKANLTIRSDKAVWRHIASVALGNSVSGFDQGDSVGVVEPWTWPDPFIGMSVEIAKAVQLKIASGAWRKSPKSTTWAGVAVAEVLGVSLSDKAERARVAGLLDGWLLTDALRVVVKKDANRVDREFIEVGKWIV